ncbi:AraC family ligand binding domain-containing protein [Solibacillus sp. FSL R7-0668]|uniref:cupin domain-containing protein n=1 Tax=Solibacillus sp. FSL R7-0668 TaxID=2921688 RepID=UPI0030FA9090
MEKIRIENVLSEQVKKVGKAYSREKMDMLTIQLQTGQQVPAHNAKETVVVIVRSGEVKFDIEGKEQLLTAEDVLIIEPLEMHSLQAVTNVDLIVMKFAI